MQHHYDIIIVGAGPAGSIAAFRISRKGYRVLLIDKSDFPRDKSCGDGLTRTSTKLLHELDLLDNFSTYQRIKGIKVFVENEGHREINYPEYLQEPGYGLVIPRLKLDNILLQKAIEKGANFMGKKLFDKLLYDEKKKVIGVKLSSGESYYADMIIGADGAASKIAYQALLASTPKNKLGFGLRGYYKNVKELNDKLEIYLPILNSSTKMILPSYGWVFPLGNNIANIGVGLIEKNSSDNIQTVLDGFINKLKNIDHRFLTMELNGKLFGAPMRFDFKPDSTFAPGLLLVGDAAGMISPFTGEGIGYAIETAIIASDLYLELKMNNEEDFSDLSKYGKILALKYQGYFEAGTSSVNRYQLVWKVLKGTFKNDKPLFRAIRQATIFPEGIGESFFKYYTQDTSRFIKNYKGELKTDLLTISDNIINLTRDEWPFLSRLFSAANVTPGIPFRPSLFLLLSGYDSQRHHNFQADRDVLIKLGTAIELGLIATICHDSIMEDYKNSVNSSVNWGNMLSILIGDYLFSKSFEITAALDSRYTVIISEALSCSNEGLVLLKNKIDNDIQNISLEEYLELCYLKNKYTFELCMKLGSVVRGAEMAEINALEKFGKYFGTAYFIGEDTINYIKKKRIQTVEEFNPLYFSNEQSSLIQVFLENRDRKFSVNKKDCLQYCYMTILNEINKAKRQIENIENLSLKEFLDAMSNFVLKKNLSIQQNFLL